MYANDLVPFSWYSSDLGRLLEECEKFGADNYIIYNCQKLFCFGDPGPCWQKALDSRFPLEGSGAM